MNEQKIKEILSDEAYVKELFSLETPEEVQQSLEGKDIELSIEEIMHIKDLLEKKLNGELSDEDLENVVGGEVGMFLVAIATVIAAAGYGHILGSAASRSGRRW